MSEPGLNLRDRKKRRTRERIVASARELFRERGYNQTSVADIAERADVGVSTLFGYFATKSDVLLAGIDELCADFVATIESRGPAESAIDATLRWHAKLAEERRDADPSSPELEWFGQRRRIIEDDPVLQGLEIQKWTDAKSALARAVAQELGDAETALRPNLVGATKVALYGAFFRHLASSDPVDFATAAVDHEYVGECFRAAADAIAAVPVPGVGIRRVASASA